MAAKEAAAATGVKEDDVKLLDAEEKAEAQASAAASSAAASADKDGSSSSSSAASAAAAKASSSAAPAASGDGDVSMQMPRFADLHDEYADLEHIKNRVKRTGWTRKRPGYKILCCGNSAEDLLIITTLFIILYICVGLFFWGLLEFYMATQDDFAALYVFAGLIGAGWLALLTTVACGERAVAKQNEEGSEAEGESEA